MTTIAPMPPSADKRGMRTKEIDLRLPRTDVVTGGWIEEGKASEGKSGNSESNSDSADEEFEEYDFGGFDTHEAGSGKDADDDDDEEDEDEDAEAEAEEEEEYDNLPASDESIAYSDFEEDQEDELELSRMPPEVTAGAFREAVRAFETGTRSDAVAALRAAVEGAATADTRAEASFTLSLALAAEGDHPGGVASARDAVRYAPDEAAPRVNLAAALARAGETDAAFEALRAVTELDLYQLVRALPPLPLVMTK